jgi:cobaltochelatase CobN
VDGRLITRAVSFKADVAGGGFTATVYRPLADRFAFVAAQAAAWVRLAARPPRERRIALVLSNYPDRAGRIANGVGLDTPESAVRIARAMAGAGYDVTGFPDSSASLMSLLTAEAAITSPRWGEVVRPASAGRAGEGECSPAASTSPPASGTSAGEVGGRPDAPPPHPAPLARFAPKRRGPLPTGERVEPDKVRRASGEWQDGAITSPWRGEVVSPAPAGRAGEREPSPAGLASPPTERLSLADYAAFLSTLPPSLRDALLARWGPPEADPHFADGAFPIKARRFGNVVVGIQPARGYGVDPKAAFHDPALVPPHHYLAFYAWLRTAFAADAIVQVGKHGNLEWLPGKALGLSAECWPEAALGTVPLVYPFIVNDPGEGSQAKRRSSAVIVDHLMPAMTRAESHGGLAELETLIDEYYVAAGMDERRRAWLEGEILAATERSGIAADLGLSRADTTGTLQAIDAHLCDIKEMQIRDGLHVLGDAPAGRQRIDTLAAIARVPRSGGRPEDASLQRAIAEDLALGFDPLASDPATPWTGPRPSVLSALSAAPWRSAGDTVERIEMLAARLVGEPPGAAATSLRWGEVVNPAPAGRAGEGWTEPMKATLSHAPPDACQGMEGGASGRDVASPPHPAPLARAATSPRWGEVVSPAPAGRAGEGVPQPLLRLDGIGDRTRAVLAWIANTLAPALDRSGGDEIAAVLAALDGRFVPPGPAGAPTRGRPDVLPTGRNFYSVDVRAVPTAAAWAVGRAAAEAMALRYFQDEGAWPRAVALSAWSTSNMRTGGDDIAQALALIGAMPEWEAGTGRVTGFRILPLAELGRPRIDVTLKISGMFRDAFPGQIDLLDSAIRAVAALEEDETANPIAASVREEMRRLSNTAPALAERHAAARIFGSRPGTYGTGLQTLMDGEVWTGRSDLAEAFTEAGHYAYGGRMQGEAVSHVFRARLKAIQAVIQPQDDREHDILDSDEYWQFAGGFAAAVQRLRGVSPRLYHADTAFPERPRIRPLQEEIGRVVRGRAANPKWLSGMMRHGYKGASEMAATVDYLYAFAATTDAVGDHHFDELYQAFIGNAEVLDFLRGANPAALREMGDKFRRAIERGLWSPRSNSAYDRLSALINEARAEAAE